MLAAVIKNKKSVKGVNNTLTKLNMCYRKVTVSIKTKLYVSTDRVEHISNKISLD